MTNNKNKRKLSVQNNQSKSAISIQSVHKQRFSINFKLALLLGIISFLVYANSLRNGFVLDDLTAITQNTIVAKGVSAIPEILSTPYRRGFFITANDLYRPLSLVSFAIEYQCFGKDPMPYHFFNILLFVGCVILLFLFLDKFFERKKIAVAFIASLLFALHPIHTEVVDNIKSRDELLCFFFAFLSLIMYIKYIRDGKIWQILSGSFCFFLSFLAKETVVTFLAVIPLIFFFYRNQSPKRSSYIMLSVVLATILLFIIRYSVLNFYQANQSGKLLLTDNALANIDISSSSRIATAILILGFYVKLLFVPYPLICDYGYNTIPYTTFSSPWVLISLVVYISLAVYSIRRFINNHKDPYAFGVFFFLITISLFSNIPFLIGTNMGERLLFFPSVGFCLIVALLLIRVSGIIIEKDVSFLRNRKLMGIIIPIALLYIIIIANRNSEWVSNYSLFYADVKKAPECSKLNLNLGIELLTTIASEEKDPTKFKQVKSEGMSHINKSLVIYPDYEYGQSELCTAYFQEGLFDSAEVHGQKAINLNPNNASALSDLGGIYFNRRDYAKTIEYCKRLIKIKSGDAQPYANIGLCYSNLNKFDSAIYYTNKAISINPSFKMAYSNLVIIYMAMGKPDSVKKYEIIAQKNNSGFK